MGRNKKDAAQDVLTLYNQMQEDEIIESGKEEIHATLNEIGFHPSLFSTYQDGGYAVGMYSRHA